MTQILLDKTGAPRADQARGFVSAARRAFGLTLDMERLSPKEQEQLLRLWFDVLRTDNDGFHLPALGKRERKTFERLLSRAAGAEVNVFDEAQRQDRERAELQKMAARVFRADRTKKEATGFQSRLLVVLSEFVNKYGLGVGDIGVLGLLLALWESGDLSGFRDVRFEDGAIVVGYYGGFARAATRGEALAKPLEHLQVAQFLTLERTGNRETVIRKGPLLVAIENDLPMKTP